MNRNTTILIGTAFLLIGYFVFSSRSAGIANVFGWDATGSPISTSLCSNCHSGGSFNSSVTMTLLDGNTPVNSYTPGQSYIMVLQVNGTANLYGAQAVALTASNSNAGTMGTPITANTQVVDLSGISYLEHDQQSATGTFAVPWTAPSQGTGNVNLYYIGNAVNGSGTGGDDPTPPAVMTITEAALPTCSDGIQNQDETGIDCGGSTCPPCIPTLYVDDTATGTNDGSSWANAFTDLQDALAIGAGYVINIAEGTYTPGTARGAVFDIPNQAILSGGFSDGGLNYDPTVYETILSGEIDGIVGFDGNSYHVVRVKDVQDIEIKDLTIRDGSADDTNSFGRARGGGVYATGSTVTFNNTTFKMNKAIYGGALFATLSPNVTFLESQLENNQADFGGALYHSNTTNMFIYQSRIIQNTSNVRCALEVNNSLYTYIENSIIADNISANANAIGLIATNRDQTFDMVNSTVLGESGKNRSLFSMQIGFGDVLDVNIDNSIMAHQSNSFNKNIVVFNNNILNFNSNHNYFAGSELSNLNGVGTNNIVENGTLYASTAGDLMQNPDFSLNPCSPAVNTGNDALSSGINVDIDGNNRFFGIVDMGAYEAQISCVLNREVTPITAIKIYPNPTQDKIYIQGNLEDVEVQVINTSGQLLKDSHQMELDISDLANGTYFIRVFSQGQLKATEKIMKMN